MKTITSFTRATAVASVMLCSTLAHSASVFDIEYSPSKSAYEQTIGLGFYQISSDSFIGWYGNFHGTLSKNEPKYDTLNVGSFGDPVNKRFKEVYLGNLGITGRLTSNLGIYVGAGYASAKGVAQKFDPMLILASDGIYYVDDPANDKSGANFNAGVLAMFGGVAVNAGYNSFTKSFVVGIGASF